MICCCVLSLYFGTGTIIMMVSSANQTVLCRILVVFALVNALLVSCSQSKQWYIDQTDSECVIDGQQRQNLCNITFAFSSGNHQNSTVYHLSEGTHYLYDSVTFRSLSDLTIAGDGSSQNRTVVECGAPDSGLAFEGVFNILLENITFRGCAAPRNICSEVYTVCPHRVGLYFSLCENVKVISVTVADGLDATGIAICDTVGKIFMNHSVFVNNSLNNSHPEGRGEACKGSGGLHIGFNYCDSGDKHREPSQYTFFNCTFKNNHGGECSDAIATMTPALSEGKSHTALGSGGGLSMFFMGNVTNKTISVLNCTFDDNSAWDAAGLYLRFQDNATANVVTVCNSTFSSNHGRSNGGGMSVSHHVRKETAFGKNKVYIENCTFDNNTANNGGALFISIAPQDITSDRLFDICVNNSEFVGNKAFQGAAVHVLSSSFFHDGMLPRVVFAGNTFTHNEVSNKSTMAGVYQHGTSIFYSNHAPVQFQGKTLFAYSLGSALCLFGSYAEFTFCFVEFKENRARRGGAIALFGGAKILFDSSSSFTFTKNFARVKGGAIYNLYLEIVDTEHYSQCFVHHKNQSILPEHWNTTFSFSGNEARMRGNSIYSSSILPCYINTPFTGGTTSNVNNNIVFCSSNWNYSSSNCSLEVSSDPGRIELTSDGSIDVIPGKQFNLPLQVWDDLGYNITNQTVFTIMPMSDNSTGSVDLDYQYVSGGRAQLLGIVNTTAEFALGGTDYRTWHIRMKVNLQTCPPGFTISDNGSLSRCICNKNIFLGKIFCNPKTFDVYMHRGYWFGVDPRQGHRLAVALCLPGFCTTGNYSIIKLESSITKLDQQICGPQYRTGVMCGKCKDGFGPSVNSDIFQCVQCNTTNITANVFYYVLARYVPIIILFTLIILFNIRLTTGPANAFILYSQAISGTFDLRANGHIQLGTIISHPTPLVHSYVLPYGIFNLDFFECFLKPLCFGTHLNTLDVLQLSYLVALFPLLMIILVVVLIKLKDCFHLHFPTGKKILHSLFRSKVRESLVHSFAAFLLLSYTKFSLTTSHILSFHSLYDENGKEIDKRIHLAGQFSITEKRYILRYLLPSCFIFITFIAIPPLLLLDYPVRWMERIINKFSLLKKAYPADKVQILLDTFQGCYRSKMRFFAGMYFIFRLVFHLIDAIVESWLQQFMLQQMVIVIFITLIAILQPYNDKFLNYVDIIIFVNLAILNMLSLFLYEYSTTSSTANLSVFPVALQYSLVFLPLIYMIVYSVYCLLKPHREKFKVITKWFSRKRDNGSPSDYQRMDQDDSPVTTSEVTLSRSRWSSIRDYSSDLSALFARARRENRYRPPQVLNPIVGSTEANVAERDDSDFQTTSLNN